MTTQEFQTEFLSRSTLPKAESPEDIIKSYVEIRRKTLEQAKELGVGSDGLGDIKQKVGKAFVRRWMMQRYASVDLSFTKKKWWFKVERDSSGEPKITQSFATEPTGTVDHVTCLIAETEVYFETEQDVLPFAFGLDDDRAPRDTVSHDLGNMVHGRRDKASLRHAQISISAKVPGGILAKHVKIAQAAMGHFHLAIALAYSHGIDLKTELNKTRYDRDQPKIRIVWAPTLESLSVTATPPRPPGDPAIILDMYDQTFLLDFYDTPDEQPIEHLIREFSEGRIR